MREDLVWRTANGGRAEILAIDASTIALKSETPHPPGSRIEGTLANVASVTGVTGVSGARGTLRVKVHGSRKEADGLFRIDGRPIDLGRELREALIAIVVAKDAGREGQDARLDPGQDPDQGT